MSFNIRDYPPGLIVISHDDMDQLEMFFSGLPKAQVAALQREGYLVIGLHTSFQVTQLSDAQLKTLGLKRIKIKPRTTH